MTHVLLIGNPNCGKTTLFNALTGDNQKVGNWPGVTVEKKTGAFTLTNQSISITDLPGIYSLNSSCVASQDEQIAANAIVTVPADVIINVVDACHLERHLYLTSQLLELGKPVILALNMIDIAKQRGIAIDITCLAQQLQCPVIAIQAHKKVGLNELQQAILHTAKTPGPLDLQFPSDLQKRLNSLKQDLIRIRQLPATLAQYYAMRSLEGDNFLIATHVGEDSVQLIKKNSDDDILLADARYQKIHQIISLVQKKHSDASEHFTAKLDRVLLHRYLALPIFFAVMYLMFLFAINIGGALQDFFDITSNALFVQGPKYLLEAMHTPPWLIALLAYGVGVGITTTLTFIPVIAAMFFFLALLEVSGYMARAAFVVDKIMRLLGLPGKAFVPMIVGFGCNVPAIMAARTLDSDRERLLTIVMSPFMSCSARLAIYSVFVAAFFPYGGQNIVFCLYMIGILMAVTTGFILRKTTLRGYSSPLILELPAYHRPTLGRLLKEMSLRLRYFITRAGRLIIPVCVILSGLNALTIDGGFSAAEASTQSMLSLLGQWLTPLFSPMGIEANNWPATVGLLTGMLAKEVVIGSLNSLYAQLSHLGHYQAAGAFNLWQSLHDALWSIPQNLSELGHALINPILASAPDNEVSQSVYGEMSRRFDGQAGAFAYLLFVLLYIPCVSTMAAIRQEASRKLMWFSVSWSFLIAYASAVIFYQIARFNLHPLQSLVWIILMLISIGLFIIGLRYRALHLGTKHALTNS
ncbi:ferrous iron transport protein B [Legionella beliardensis]|uniref:Ferrous iron transport protein B n=1 Tax=Legionella beliardensis TaxID=91822 RepID=A0A378I4D3_9GAMM|nr:Fe(2+) transporter permease subunit FeoB [Legionella beliardensis]STX30048.1 ferrous iron transport protein B [Legionella beliardensis]